MTQDKFGVAGVQWQRAANNELAGHRADLFQHVIDSRPVYSQQKCIRILRGFFWRSCSRLSTGVSRHPIQFIPAARIAENHLVPCSRKERAEFSAHQSRTENTNSHGFTVSHAARGVARTLARPVVKLLLTHGRANMPPCCDEPSATVVIGKQASLL